MREAEVYLSQGKTVGQACKTLEISEQTYYRWRREYGGMDVTQARKLKAVNQAIQALDVSERRACRVVGQPRATQRYNKRPANDEDFLTKRIIELASQYGRYGYRRVTALLRNEGWIVNHKRVERIWRREGLKIPPETAKKRTVMAQ